MLDTFFFADEPAVWFPVGWVSNRMNRANIDIKAQCAGTEGDGQNDIIPSSCSKNCNLQKLAIKSHHQIAKSWGSLMPMARLLPMHSGECDFGTAYDALRTVSPLNKTKRWSVWRVN
jgi:hypothetical protein